MAATFQIDPKRFDALSGVMPLDPVADPELSRRELSRRAFDHGPVSRSTESGHGAAPRPGTTPLQVIVRGEADRIRDTCHGVTLGRGRIDRVLTGEPVQRAENENMPHCKHNALSRFFALIRNTKTLYRNIRNDPFYLSGMTRFTFPSGPLCG
ncbi:MAG: hypothetical protein ACPGSB_05130 [Opitutales bacterium]